MRGNSQNTSSCFPSSIRSVAFPVAAEVEPVLEDRLGVKTQLPEEGCHVAVVAALVQEEMDDELAPAVPEKFTVDVNLVWFAEVGFGPCVEIGSELVAGRAAVG